MATANKDENYVYDEGCNWCEDGDGLPCDSTPTTYVGDIYYACEDHRDDMVNWMEDDT